MSDLSKSKLIVLTPGFDVNSFGGAGGGGGGAGAAVGGGGAGATTTGGGGGAGAGGGGGGGGATTTGGGAAGAGAETAGTTGRFAQAPRNNARTMVANAAFRMSAFIRALLGASKLGPRRGRLVLEDLLGIDGDRPAPPPLRAGCVDVGTSYPGVLARLVPHRKPPVLPRRKVRCVLAPVGPFLRACTGPRQQSDA